jgi:LppP/LprE lipoprotein
VAFDLNARAVQTAIRSMEVREGPLDILRGNFDPCATLSVVLVYPKGASGSAVIQPLMFHEGDYVGPATPRGYSYMGLNEGATTADTVVLTFRATAGSCNACNDAIYEDVRFRWQDGEVVALDPIPGYAAK